MLISNNAIEVFQVLGYYLNLINIKNVNRNIHFEPSFVSLLYFDKKKEKMKMYLSIIVFFRCFKAVSIVYAKL